MEIQTTLNRLQQKPQNLLNKEKYETNAILLWQISAKTKSSEKQILTCFAENKRSKFKEKGKIKIKWIIQEGQKAHT